MRGVGGWVSEVGWEFDLLVVCALRCPAAVACSGVWLRKQLKGTAWLSAVSSQSGRVARGARVLRVGASWAGRGAEIEV